MHDTLFILISFFGLQSADGLELCRKPFGQISAELQENLQPLQLCDGLKKTHRVQVKRHLSVSMAKGTWHMQLSALVFHTCVFVTSSSSSSEAVRSNSRSLSRSSSASHWLIKSPLTSHWLTESDTIAPRSAQSVWSKTHIDKSMVSIWTDRGHTNSDIKISRERQHSI